MMLCFARPVTDRAPSGQIFRTLFVCLCRDTLSEVLRLLRGLPHCLLRLPAVLHGPAELGLHLLLQHAALQRAQEEAPRALGGDVEPTDEPPSPLPDLLPAAADAPPTDVDWRIPSRLSVHFISPLRSPLCFFQFALHRTAELRLVTWSQKAKFCKFKDFFGSRKQESNRFRSSSQLQLNTKKLFAGNWVPKTKSR